MNADKQCVFISVYRRSSAAIGFPAAAVALMLAGCGYVGEPRPPLAHIPPRVNVGEPRPPLANIPPRVSDLAVVQRGGQLIVQFSVPALTTEGHPIPRPLKLDLRAGTADQFEPNQWAAGARQIRSEEHTSALQSPCNLVCRLLLEKK